MNNNKKNVANHKPLTGLVNQQASPKVYKSLNAVRQIIYPASCLLCDANTAANAQLCDDCHAELPWNTSPCQHCALPLPASATSTICAQCLQQAPGYSNAVAPLQYNPTVAWLVTQLKFHQQLGHARLLADLLLNALHQRAHPRPDRILPVPLHSSRLRERGYNQALEIARPIAKQLAIPLDTNSVQRIRATPPQVHLKLKERKRNIRGAFRCEHDLSEQHIVIVDDVVTSGATTRELAQQLRKAGAAKISLWAVARAPA